MYGRRIKEEANRESTRYSNEESRQADGHTATAACVTNGLECCWRKKNLKERKPTSSETETLHVQTTERYADCQPCTVFIRTVATDPANVGSLTMLHGISMVCKLNFDNLPRNFHHLILGRLWKLYFGTDRGLHIC